MKLLLVTTPDQQNYLARFSRLSALIGHPVQVLMRAPDTVSELEVMCSKHSIEGILCANQELLERILNATLDFNKPDTRKALTLDDYQGSLLATRTTKIPVVVLNPPEHVMSVAYGAFVFDRFIKKLTAPARWFQQTKFEWEIADESTIENLYNEFKAADYIAIDIETPRTNPDLLVSCISFTGYWHSSHRSNSVVVPFTSLFFLTWIRKFCALPIPKILQGGSYDAVYLLRFNCPILYWYFDTLHLFHSWYSELPKRLDFVGAFTLRNIRYWKDDGKSGGIESYYRYNAMDGWATLNAFLALMGELPAWAINNYRSEFPLVFPAIHCEIEGWKVDEVQFAKVKAEKEKVAAEKLVSIQKMVSAPNFNPRSPKQMLTLFKLLGCQDLKSTDKANTMKAEYRHPLNSRILGEIKEYKAAAKLLSTYIVEDKLYRWRLYYRLDPGGTDTGRLASKESSFWFGFQIQNIPRGDSIKSFLISDAGWKLAEPDFEQSEARCVAYLSGDEKLIQLVESGKDYHSWNAQEFFGIKYEELWDEEKKAPRNKAAKEIRDTSKRTNHGANYNMAEGVMLDTMGPKAVALAKVLLKLPASLTLKAVCKYCLDRYAATYTRVKGLFYQSVILEIETTKKLTSPLGHVRWFFGDPRGNKHYLNAAVAHKPQNLSVSIMNKCFYKVWWESVYGVFRGVLRLKAQIHDSLPYQYKVGAEWVNERVREYLTCPTEIVGADKIKRTMLIPVSVSHGKQRWSELK